MSKSQTDNEVKILDFTQGDSDLDGQIVSASSLLAEQKGYIDSIDLDQLLGEISLNNISSGVFGATGTNQGIEFGSDVANNISYIQSKNYVEGSAGYRFGSDGIIHAVGGVFSGYIEVGGGAADVNAGSTTINGGKITTNSIAASAIITGQLIVGTNVGLGTAQDSAGVTTIIGNTVTTGYVNALSVVAGSVACENLTGTTITGKTISGGSVSGTTITGAFYSSDIIPYSSSAYDLGSSTYKFKDLHLSGNITIAGTVDGTDISTHVATASAHHSSTSSGLAITPSSVNTGYIHLGDVNSYDILPYADNYGSFGYRAGVAGQPSNRRWAQIHGVNIQTGDLWFENRFRITEEGKKGLAFFNKRNKKIAILNDKGDFLIKGEIKKL